METYSNRGKIIPLHKNPIKVMRQFCWECMGWNINDIEGCTAPDCPLYPWRKGKNPYRKEKTAKQLSASKRNVKKMLNVTSN